MNANEWSSGCGVGHRSDCDSVESVRPIKPVKDTKDHSPNSSMACKYKGKTLSPSLTPLNLPPHQLSPKHTRPPLRPQPSIQDLIIRLETLLDSVISILRSPSPNPRIYSLHAFYDRIVDLLSYASTSSTSSTAGTTLALNPEMVERLEMEWWNSEIVAAWFGPTRALRERGLVRVDDSPKGVNVKADMVYVGLHDE